MSHHGSSTLMPRPMKEPFNGTHPFPGPVVVFFFLFPLCVFVCACAGHTTSLSHLPALPLLRRLAQAQAASTDSEAVLNLNQRTTVLRGVSRLVFFCEIPGHMVGRGGRINSLIVVSGGGCGRTNN